MCLHAQSQKRMQFDCNAILLHSHPMGNWKWFHEVSRVWDTSFFMLWRGEGEYHSRGGMAVVSAVPVTSV